MINFDVIIQLAEMNLDNGLTHVCLQIRSNSDF